MKKSLLILSIVLCIHSNAQSSWINVGSAGFSAGKVYVPSIAIDGSCTPYVAYADYGSHVTVMKYDGSAWVAVGSIGEVGLVDMVLDGNGTPYLLFMNASNQKATVMKYDGSAWVTVGSPDFSASVDWLSIAIDHNSGTPYVAFDVASDHKITVMKYDGSAWVVVGSTGFSGQTSSLNDVSIAIDHSGTPYVAYRDGTSASSITVMKYDGSAWVTVGSAGFAAGLITGVIYITIDHSSGTPCVAFRDNSGKVTMMRFDGTSWVNVGSASFSAEYVAWAPIAVDNSSTPYVLCNGIGTDTVTGTVMKYDGSSWVTVGAAGSVGGRGSIAIDTNGTPYVAYVDNANGGKATVMKYTEATGIQAYSKDGFQSIYPNPANNVLNIELQNEAAIEIYSVTGQLIQKEKVAQHHSVDVSNYPSGIYFIRSSKGGSAKFVKE